jgi:hypothetical protein
MEKKVFKISKRKLKKGLIVFLISFIALFIINHFGEFQYENRLSDEASQRSMEHFSRQQMPEASSNEYDANLQQDPPNLRNPDDFVRAMEQAVKEGYKKRQANRAPGTGIATPFYHSSFDYVVTKISLNTIGGISASKTYDEPFFLGGFGSAYKTDNITGAREEMSYLDKIPFYILSTIYNIHCILIMMILFFGINYLYKKVEFQIN